MSSSLDEEGYVVMTGSKRSSLWHGQTCLREWGFTKTYERMHDTQRWEDFGIIETNSARPGQECEALNAKILAIPAPLACIWFSD